MNSQKKLTSNSSKKAELNNFSTNSQINHSNKTYINNIKKSINLKNSKLSNQNPIKYISNNSTNMNSNNKINCLTNKYKTTKNSPNKLFKKENPKSLKYLNKKTTKKNMNSNDSKKNNKLNSKASINNSTNTNKNINANNNNKIIIINKKSNEKVLIEEIFKKKLAKKKNKKSVTTKNSNNNSINLSNTSYRNMQINSSDIIIPRLKFNNFNNGNKFQKIKEHIVYMRDDGKEKNININRDNINFTNFMTNSIILKNINSYREKDSLKRVNAISEKHFGDKKNNYYGQTSKDFYIIKKYISSMLTNQPQRKQKSHFSKTRKYNTITNKKILNKFEKERNIVSTSRKHNINNKISINKKIEVNNKNKISNKHGNGDYTIFVKSNFHLKNISKMSNPTKQNSQKESVEKNIKNEDKELKVKTLQKKAGMPIRLSNDNNNNIKATNKSISTNNYSYQNSEIFNKSNNFNNKKVDIDYNYVYNNYILNNKKGLQQNIKNMKKKIYSTKSSKEKISSNMILQKKNCLDKLFKKFQKNNSNYRSNNYSKDELAYKRNLSNRLKTPRQIMNNNKKINVNKKSNIYGIRIKNIKCMKNTPKLQKNYLNHNHKSKKNNKISDKNSGSNSKVEINTKNSLMNNKELSKSNKINQIIKKKLENINEENNNENINEKSKQFEDNFIENKEIKIEEEKNNENKENESENKKKELPDKDLSDVEEDNTLLEYLNSNIDINLTNNDTSILNESYESMNSNLRDNNRYFCFNKSKEIITKYIKQYYIKHKKYPKTKMKFYKYGRLLGRGAYGKVNLCLHTLTGRLVAIKSINKSKITKERQREKIKI